MVHLKLVFKKFKKKKEKTKVDSSARNSNNHSSACRRSALCVLPTLSVRLLIICIASSRIPLSKTRFLKHCDCDEKLAWFGVTALIPAKATAAFPTTALAPSVQTSTQ